MKEKLASGKNKEAVEPGMKYMDEKRVTARKECSKIPRQKGWR